MSFGGGGLRRDFAHCAPNRAPTDTARRPDILLGREAVPAGVRGRGGVRAGGGGMAGVRVRPGRRLADDWPRAIVSGVLQRSPRTTGCQVLGRHLGRIL